MVWPKRALYIYVSSRHGGCRASTALQPLQLLYSCSTALQLYIALHSTTSTLTICDTHSRAESFRLNNL